MALTVRSYMDNVHNTERLIERFASVAEEHRPDTLVGTGLSGLLAITKLADAYGLDYLAVRKESDGSHSSQPAEGSLGARWMFVDDLISSGATFSRCYSVVARLCDDRKHQSEYIGSWTYERHMYWPVDDPELIGRITRIKSRILEEREERTRQEAEERQADLQYIRDNYQVSEADPGFTEVAERFLREDIYYYQMCSLMQEIRDKRRGIATPPVSGYMIPSEAWTAVGVA